MNEEEEKFLFHCCFGAKLALKLCVEVEKVEAQGKTSMISFFFTSASVCQIALSFQSYLWAMKQLISLPQIVDWELEPLWIFTYTHFM